MTAEHYPYCHLHKIYSSSIHSPPLLTRYIQDAFWETVEDEYEDVLLPQQILLVSYTTSTYNGQSIHIDFQSKKIVCPHASPHRPCWERYVVYYLEGEASPLPWNWNGSKEVSSWV